MTYASSINLQPYKIESIDITETPAGAEGTDWYHYVITQGGNKIHGYRQGSFASVRMAVEVNVDMLNERQLGKRSRAYTTKNTKR